MSRTERPATPPERGLRRTGVRSRRFAHHGDDVGFELSVEQLRVLAADDVDDFEGELEVAAFVAEDPVGAGGEAVEQAAARKK
jgi:hypothetical protein